MKILLVEDEVKTAQSIKQGLEENGIETEVAYDGQVAVAMVRGNVYDVIVSDVIIPYVNGIDFCRQLRNMGNGTPVLMISAMSTTDDKLTGFDAGADDYLSKPFEFAELLARIRALGKRGSYNFSAANIVKFEDLQLNLNTKSVTRGDKKIDLTAKEFTLLEYLVRNQGRVISKSEIAEKVWDIHFDTGTNVIEVYVNYLRKKIDKEFETKLIHTQFGMGYVIKKG
jgi:two-component system copper resistance phosphate regulon response regulator CusR